MTKNAGTLLREFVADAEKALASICKNEDHREQGAHDLDGQPVGSSKEDPCEYASCYAWAKATHQDPAFVAGLRADHLRNFGKMPAEPCGCVYDRGDRRRLVVCRDHAAYGCEPHGYLFTTPNRAGIHARSSHGRTLREAIAGGIMWSRNA